jgi:tape measure domain-containing protein
MATERIEIVITERGSKTVQRNLQNVGRTAQGTSKALALLKRALGVLGGALIIRQMIQLADAFTNLQNRLRLVTSSTGQLTLITRELFAISQRTRSSFSATGELFGRVALATKALGISQQQTLDFTESLNQAVILSGAGAVEAEQGIRQLAQGLASNRLSGDELRSVLEQLPLVADVIARRLGVTRGELRKMGEEGKITAEVVLNAFKDAREELAERFADTVPTVGQAFTVLNNAITFTIGELSKATGFTEGLAKALIFLAQNIETITRLVGAAGLLGIFLLIPPALTLIATGIKAVTLAIAANPLGALAVALTSLIALSIAFADEITIFTTTLEDGTEITTTFSDVLVGAFDVAVTLINAATKAIGNFFSTGQTGGAGFGQLIFNILKTFSSFINNVLKILTGLTVGIIESFTSIPRAIKDIFISIFNSLIGLVESGVNKITRAVNTVRTFLGADEIEEVSFGRIENDAAGGAVDFGKKFADGFKKGFDAPTVFDQLISAGANILGPAVGGATQERLGQEIVDKATREFEKNRLATAGEAVTKPDPSAAKFRELITELEQENQLLGVNALERERLQAIIQFETSLKRKLTASEREQVEALLKTNQSLQKQAEILDEFQGPQIQFGLTLQAIDQLFADGKITVEQYTQKLREAQLAVLETDRTLAGGVQRGLLQISEQFTDLATLTETTLVNAFQAAEDALVQFVQTGKLDFKSLVDSIFNDLTRIAVRGAITGPIAGLFAPKPGEAGGGGGGGFLDTLISGAGALFGGGSSTQPSGGGGGDAASTVGALAGLSSLFGFQDGGRFTVGGGGGPDSQLVAFKASPNEEVEITPPGRRSSRAPIINFNISTPDADSFQRSQQQILAKTQATLSRANVRNN